MTARRSFAQVAAEAVARDRADIVAFGRDHVAGLQRMVESGKIGADEASLLSDRLIAFIEMIGQGLHASDAGRGAANAGVRNEK